MAGGEGRTEGGAADEGTVSVQVTPEAAALVRSLEEEHGPVMFHQSGGCCDGSAPMCFLRGEFLVGPADVLLGDIEGAPFYIGRAQWERWSHTRLTVDVVPGRGSGFSLEAPRGVRFLLRSDVCTIEEGPE